MSEVFGRTVGCQKLTIKGAVFLLCVRKFLREESEWYPGLALFLLKLSTQS